MTPRPMLVGKMDWLKRLICRVRGHEWAFECDGLKRRCPRCHREDWAMGNPYPMIGEPKYYWKTMYDWRG